MQSHIVDSGASGYFFSNDAHKKNVDTISPRIWVGTASGQPMTSSGSCDFIIHELPSDFPTTGHFVPGSQ